MPAFELQVGHLVHDVAVEQVHAAHERAADAHDGSIQPLVAELPGDGDGLTAADLGRGEGERLLPHREALAAAAGKCELVDARRQQGRRRGGDALGRERHARLAREAKADDGARDAERLAVGHADERQLHLGRQQLDEPRGVLAAERRGQKERGGQEDGRGSRHALERRERGPHVAGPSNDAIRDASSASTEANCRWPVNPITWKIHGSLA